MRLKDKEGLGMCLGVCVANCIVGGSGSMHPKKKFKILTSGGVRLGKSGVPLPVAYSFATHTNVRQCLSSQNPFSIPRGIHTGY